jgi:hypothetical protein
LKNKQQKKLFSECGNQTQEKAHYHLLTLSRAIYQVKKKVSAE